MTFWIIIGALTLFVLAVVLFPLLRSKPVPVDDTNAHDSVVYQDQLKELDRDIERGVIDAKQAKSARNEIARRLLSVASKSEKPVQASQFSVNSGRLVALASAIVIAAGSSLLYLKIGRPDLPDLPQKQRIANALKNNDKSALVFQVQQVLKKNPKDVRGWKVLAPILKSQRRYGEAAEAYGKILQLEAPSPQILVDYAESVILANNGQASKQAVYALETAVKLDKKHAQAHFYLGVVYQQVGSNDKALEQFQLLITQNPDNKAVRQAAERQIARINKLSGKVPALDKDQRKSGDAMTPQEQKEMVAGMVQRLADKMKANPKDLPGWLRLIRAYSVMGDKDKAKSVLATAKTNFPNNEKALEQLNGMAKGLELDK